MLLLQQHLVVAAKAPQSRKRLTVQPTVKLEPSLFVTGKRRLFYCAASHFEVDRLGWIVCTVFDGYRTLSETIRDYVGLILLRRTLRAT